MAVEELNKQGHREWIHGSRLARVLFEEGADYGSKLTNISMTGERNTSSALTCENRLQQCWPEQSQLTYGLIRVALIRIGNVHADLWLSFTVWWKAYLMFLEERLVIEFVLKSRLLWSNVTTGLQDSTRHDQWCQNECPLTYYSPHTPTSYLVNQNVRSGKDAAEQTHCEQTHDDREVNEQSIKSTTLLILSELHNTRTWYSNKMYARWLESESGDHPV